MYQKAYIREECFGKKDIIFELDRIANTGQADIIKQHRIPDKTSYEGVHRTNNTPLHVLEGTKADINI